MKILVFNLATDADDAVLGFTTDWINGLAARAESVSVLSTVIGRLEVASNVKVFGLRNRRQSRSRLTSLLRFYSVLISLLRTERFDVCFAHMNPLFVLLAAPLLRAWGIPTVLWYAHKSKPWVLRMTAPLAMRIVTSSSEGCQVAQHKVAIIGQGIDTARFAPSARSANETFEIVTVGRISRVKGNHILIEALAQLREKCPEFRFRARYFGAPLTRADEEYAEELSRKVASLGLSGMVSFEEPVPFRLVHSVLRGADCFVNSSNTDSVDKAVLEAMAAGIPVLTSNAAFREIVPSSIQLHTLIPKGDAAALTRELIYWIRSSPDDRQAHGLKLREVVERGHSLNGLLDRLVSELARAVSPSAGDESHGIKRA